MSNSKKDILDSIIKESIQVELSEIEIPEMDDIWLNIESEINQSKGERPFRHKKIAMIIGFLVIFGLTLGNLDTGYGYYQRVLSFITKTDGDSTSIQIESKGNTPRNPEMELATKLQKLTLEEALNQANFIFNIPSVIPEGYYFVEAVLTEYNGQTMSVEIKYALDDETINILIKPLIGDYVESININTNHATLEKVTLNNITYNLIQFNDGSVIIIWDQDEVKYTAEGNNRDKTLELVLSIK